jgi:hypothetical protein
MLEKREWCSLSGDDGLDEKYVKRESCIKFKDAEGSETFLQREPGEGTLYLFYNGQRK